MVCGVSDISGTMTTACLPSDRHSSTADRYISVLPLPVTPCVRNILGATAGSRIAAATSRTTSDCGAESATGGSGSKMRSASGSRKTWVLSISSQPRSRNRATADQPNIFRASEATTGWADSSMNSASSACLRLRAPRPSSSNHSLMSSSAAELTLRLSTYLGDAAGRMAR